MRARSGLSRDTAGSGSLTSSIAVYQSISLYSHMKSEPVELLHFNIDKSSLISNDTTKRGEESMCITHLIR